MKRSYKCMSTSSNDIMIDTEGSTIVKEGKATVLFPSSQDVFYNPVQEFNRDMSVAVLRMFASDFLSNSSNLKMEENGIRILEGLAASGLRSIRYAKEIGGVQSIVANDVSAHAVKCINENIAYNGVQDIVTSNCDDASMAMYKHRKKDERFHAVDLDPYGSPHLFLDAAVQCTADGGILLVTSTDMAVLCGNSPETCYTKYGALSIKSKACHEIVSWLYQCKGCETITLHPLGKIDKKGSSIKYVLNSGPPVDQKCAFCGYGHHIAGPLWTYPIHDQDFVSRLKVSLDEDSFSTYKRMLGCLSMVEEELNDVPLYYVQDRLSSIAGISLCKRVKIFSALLNAGYRVSMSHTCKSSIKTDAPPQIVWDVVKTWAKVCNMNIDKMPDNKPGKMILMQDLSVTVNFDLHPCAEPLSKKNDLLRFQLNPEKFWGPKMRSKTSVLSGSEDGKRIKNQGKKKSKKSLEDNIT